MSSMGVERASSERAHTYAHGIFAAGAAAAILEAMLLPSLDGAGRTLFGVGLLVVSVSLACVRRRWAIGASIALALGLILGAIAPLVSAG